MTPLPSAILFATLTAVATCAPAILLLSPPNNSVTTFQCTNSPKWAAPDFRRRECYFAVASKAFMDELTDFDTEPVEFYTRTGGLSPLQRRETIQPVPRKYTSGRCTLTIAMLASFKNGDIPGFDPSTKPLSSRDVSTYQDISTVAHFMLGRCIAVGQMGWFAVGERDAIGVFLWEKASEIDRSVEAVNVIDGGGGNRSATPFLPGLGVNGSGTE